ncbi:amino acid ABC transporter permease [Gordonia hydrophobica]|uniref:Amino acid ABC transporter permease n=1 Tax=Gordonia hydrophobica TaxID=40516 RepID=A0ABZ2U0M7_9ACTN|nr:amino acid ABC transporter permease [Gordonia hydrophobica]MBM7367676.1 glutamate transport system permease protein [Gordonia hydrophobica]
MSDESTVLYDAPGPRARRRNLITAIVFVAIVVAVIAYVITVLAGKGQFDADKWSPFTVAGTWYTWLLPGLWGTLKAAFVSIILALVVGTLLGIGRLSDHRWVRVVCGFIVEIFRAIPVLILMFFAYFLFAKYAVVPSSQLSFAAVVFGLTLYNGSVIAEILRAGIQAVPRGQSEAAQSIGLRKSQMMRMILLPQAVTAMLPALISQMVIALKDSALGYAFGYIEVVRSGIVSASYWGNYLPSLVVVAVIMIAINFCLTGLANYLERRLRSGRRKTNASDPDVAELETMENVPGFNKIG